MDVTKRLNLKTPIESICEIAFEEEPIPISQLTVGKPTAGFMPTISVAQRAPIKVHGNQLLGVRRLATHRQVSHLIYSSERFNARAARIQSCPGQPQISPLITSDFLPTELETRLFPAMSKDFKT
jgi:hypothetical protein